jgi:hypothetical protein
MLWRGQADLITVMILVGAVLVVGVALSALAVSHVSSIASRGQIQQLLVSEQANLVLYKEFENSTTLCIGTLKITPSTTRYALALFSTDMKRDLLAQNQGAVIIPVATALPIVKRVSASSVYYVYRGEYYPLPVKGFVNVVEIPMDVIQSYVMQQKPFLVCINKSIVSSAEVSSAKLLYLVYVGSELYEVGEWCVYLS